MLLAMDATFSYIKRGENSLILSLPPSPPFLPPFFTINAWSFLLPAVRTDCWLSVYKFLNSPAQGLRRTNMPRVCPRSGLCCRGLCSAPFWTGTSSDASGMLAGGRDVGRHCSPPSERQRSVSAWEGGPDAIVCSAPVGRSCGT